MDSSTNEILDVVPPTFPYVILYPMNNKSGIPYTETDKYTVNDFIVWMG